MHCCHLHVCLYVICGLFKWWYTLLGWQWRKDHSCMGLHVRVISRQVEASLSQAQHITPRLYLSTGLEFNLLLKTANCLMKCKTVGGSIEFDGRMCFVTLWFCFSFENLDTSTANPWVEIRQIQSCNTPRKAVRLTPRPFFWMCLY